MANVESRLNLDFTNMNKYQRVYAKQGDLGRSLYVTLYRNGSEIILDSSTESATFNAKRKGTTNTITSVCVIDSNGKLRINFSDVPTLTATPGTVLCEFLITSTGGALALRTPTFEIVVDEAVVITPGS